jgi:hypothetical protein
MIMLVLMPVMRFSYSVCRQMLVHIPLHMEYQLLARLCAEMAIPFQNSVEGWMGVGIQRAQVKVVLVCSIRPREASSSRPSGHHMERAASEIDPRRSHLRGRKEGEPDHNQNHK